MYVNMLNTLSLNPQKTLAEKGRNGRMLGCRKPSDWPYVAESKSLDVPYAGKDAKENYLS